MDEVVAVVDVEIDGLAVAKDVAQGAVYVGREVVAGVLQAVTGRQPVRFEASFYAMLGLAAGWFLGGSSLTGAILGLLGLGVGLGVGFMITHSWYEEFTDSLIAKHYLTLLFDAALVVGCAVAAGLAGNYLYENPALWIVGGLAAGPIAARGVQALFSWAEDQI